MKRRSFVKKTLVGLGGIQLFSTIGCSSNSKNEPPQVDLSIGGSPLPIPPPLEGEIIDGVRVYKLSLARSTVEWVPENPTETFGVNGDFLGPTLFLNNGEEVRIEVENTLGEDSTLHFHGLHLAAKNDGGPYSVIADGETWVSEFTVDNKEMMAWYHPHLMHHTARQVAMGIAGCIYVKDIDSEIKLPNDYGKNDFPLVIQDRNFSSDGTHPYSPGKTLDRQTTMMGVKGNSILVNGGSSPIQSIEQNLIRFRILNGSNARIYNLGFSDDRTFSVIGTDGGLLSKPVEINRVILAPAERIDILVDFSEDADGTMLQLNSFSEEISSETVAQNQMGRGMSGAAIDSLDSSTFEIMTFNISNKEGEVLIPEVLEAVAEFNQEGATTRTIILDMRQGEVYINGSQMKSLTDIPDAINFKIPVKSREVWTIKNDSPMAHPFHIHDVQFQVLEVDGSTPPEILGGFKDTVLVLPNQTVKIGMSFMDFADDTTPYMFHCHILEHEDAGMMGQFFIV